MCYISLAFLRVVPQGQAAYTSVSTDDERRDSNPLKRTKSADRRSVHRHHGQHQEPGTLLNDPHTSEELHHKAYEAQQPSAVDQSSDGEPDERSSLMSKSSSSTPGDLAQKDQGHESATHHDSHHVDIRGFRLLRQVEFYQLWLLLGLLTGVGLMTIK